MYGRKPWGMVMWLCASFVMFAQSHYQPKQNKTEPHCSREALQKTRSKSFKQDKRPRISGEQEQNDQRFSKQMATYTMQDLANMSYSDMIAAVASVQWYDIDGLFTYSSGSHNFFIDQNRVRAIVDAIQARGSQYTATDDKGIPTLIEVMRAGYYLAFYNSQLGWMSTPEVEAWTKPSQDAISQNPNFTFGTETQNKLIAALGKYIGNSSVSDGMLTKSTQVIQDFLQQGLITTSSSARGAIYDIIAGVGSVLDRDIWNNSSDITKATYYNRIETYIDGLEALVAYGTTGDDWDWLLNNAIYYLGEESQLTSNKQPINRALTDGITAYTKWTMPALECARAIHNHFNDTDADGVYTSWDAILADVKAWILPNKKTFDNGAVVAIYGSGVTDEKVDRLYWATKEVSSQFFRVIGNDQALEPGNADDVLTMVLYSSPDDYKYNNILNGYSTDNGGIYIEGEGTFYTYERTPAQSIYSLEELFRHEVTHYMQGRYMVHGLWGQGGIYDGGRLNWVEEGMAEFIAGATRTESVLPRYSVSNELAKDNPSEYFTPAQLFASRYADGWAFYQYGYAFWHYMYAERPDIMNGIIKRILVDNNGNALDSYLSSIANQSSVQTGYRNKIAELAANANTSPNPAVSDDYLLNITETNLSAIQSHITSSLPLSGTSISSINSPSHKLFKLEGSYTGSTSVDQEADWASMSGIANSAVTSINDGSWAGYKTVNAHFSNYRVVNGNATYDVVVQGKLSGTGGISNQTPIAKINGPYNGSEGQEVAFNSTGSNDPDGQISSYEWTIDDNGTAVIKTVAHPKHTFSTAGTYTVTLKVVDNKGASATAQTTVTITPASGSVTSETEPNNTHAEANGEILFDTVISGKMNNSSDLDMYYFNLSSLKDVRVKLNVVSGSPQVYVLISHESDPERYLYWSDGSTNDLTFTPTQTGKYYLVTDYKFGGSTSDYNFTLTHPISSGNFITSETEVNNNATDANGPVGSAIAVTGDLTNETAGDYFYFDLATIADVSINLNVVSGTQELTWVLYHESDLGTYVAWASNNGASKDKTFTPTLTGRYYLSVYTWTTSSASYNVTVTSDGISGDGSSGSYITEETESNGSSEEANGPAGNEKGISGVITNTQDKDWFYFDLVNDGSVKIEFDNATGGATFVLYHESDISNYVAWATHSQGSVEYTNYSGAKGRYYIKIYSYNSGEKAYSLKVSSTSMEGVAGPQAPKEFDVSNHPNPFNPVTHIRFSLPERSEVYISIFNVLGQEVRTLVKGDVLDANTHQFMWDGTNNANIPMASGMYFLRISTPKFTSTKKLILIK